MSQPSPGLAQATAVASFFRVAAVRIRRDDEFVDRIAEVKSRIEGIDIRNDPDAWHAALEELVELEVKRRSL
ncbi:hypothetical protein GQ85_24370 [Rhodococcus rhodochrous]|nr:hypothetical protein GQ85_24370 [Rhodococcus rhodochrous]